MFNTRTMLSTLALLLAIAQPFDAQAGKPPKVDDSKTSRALAEGGQPRLKQRIAVTIYQVRSGIGDIDVRAATDMFTTALVKSRRFRVVERSNMGDGLSSEHQLNASGATTGDVANYQLRGAQLIFEAVISEASADAGGSDGGLTIAGVNFGRSSNKGGLGMDVRVLDARNGDVLDAVNVRKELKSGSVSVQGIGSAVDKILSRSGKSLGEYTPDGGGTISSNESIDQAVRMLIELSVKELADRSGEWFEE